MEVEMEESRMNEDENGPNQVRGVGLEGTLSDQAEQWTEKAQKIRHQVRGIAQDAGRIVVEKGRQAGKGIDQQVHIHPWQYVLGACVSGVLIGLIINRK
jgi:ElaB/YqjD/DUF883 family membrane-anchored ribosome-binding protein